jgi:hypothetical protein
MCFPCFKYSIRKSNNRDSVTEKVCQKSLLGDAIGLKYEPLMYITFFLSTV